MNTIIKFVCATAIAASSTSVLFTTTVYAQAAEVRSMSVETADLDLASPAGQDQLSRRIDRAAKEVCQGDAGSLDLKMRRAISDCIGKAKGQALGQIKSRDGKPLALKTTD
jgi:UrcA family protein